MSEDVVKIENLVKYFDGRCVLDHLDGRLKSLAELIGESEFDVVESFSYPEIGGDITLAEARRAWPSKVILPNFPSSLCHKSDEEINAFLNKMLAEAGTDKPFMLQISEDIPHEQWQRVLPVLCQFMSDHGQTKR